MADGESLKKGNTPWLAGLAALDLLGLAAFLMPPSIMGQISSIEAIKGALVSGLVVVVPLLTDTLSHKAKARLVFWRWRDPLPGCRAFSTYLKEEDHIDEKALAKNIGKFPSDSRAAGARWYELYNLVRNRGNVIETHKKYLRYRDMAAMSIALLFVVPVCLQLAVGSLWWQSLALFLAQTLWAVWLCRVAGARFVTTVLAVHSSEAIPGARKK
ncbi:hypothetical protein [Pseudoxanthomonas mexicana]|uniref:hypothetical protein n=1 Tax=Pseudoxanthomonas mexicana TaxID=128785 RepID=UPI0022F3F928|nr:hypothetical protein [Pseudoxanthomonas mexicana]WBX94950.1 hypothetical protein PE064_07125 [Pseudoxanthomonas mexicana]